jgi:hypothetical protein
MGPHGVIVAPLEARGEGASHPAAGGATASAKRTSSSPILFADRSYLTGRGGQVVPRAVAVVTGVAITNEREMLGCAVGEHEMFWTGFFRPSPVTWPASVSVGIRASVVATGVGTQPRARARRRPP